MRGPFKKQALRLLRERKVPVASVLDIGVLTETRELRTIFADVPHVLFEPIVEFNPAIAKLYSAVAHRLVNAAVSDTEGETTLAVKRILPNLPVSHSHVVAGDADGPDQRRVPMVTLDGYLAREPAPAPYLLKIDVDGHEIPVLRGAEHTLRQTNVVVIELVWHKFVERMGYLQQHGFRLFDLVEPCYYDGQLWQTDAIFIREDIADAHFAAFRSEDVGQHYSMFDDRALQASNRLNSLLAELKKRGLRISFSGSRDGS